MKFKDNLQKLRKENHMSQEQLAEKLNVSRQAVSKWESNTAYPEMDKIIAMSKIFNCTLDELVNGEEIKLKESTDIKKTINEYKDDVLTFINKSVKMLGQMSALDIIKCILFLGLIIGLLLLCKIPINYIRSLGYSFFNIFPDIIGSNLNTIWRIIIDLIYFIICIVVLVYIFKVKYLDNFNEEINNEPVNNLNENKEVIREEKSSSITQKDNYRSMTFLEFLAKIVLYFIKFLAIIMAIPLSISLICIAICLAITVSLLFKKIVYIGVLLLIFGALILNISFLEILFNFIFNGKQHLKKLFITLIISFVLIGVGVGVTSLDMANTKFIQSAPTNIKKTSDTMYYDMHDDLIINNHYYGNIIYVEDNTLTNQIKIDINYYEDFFNFNVIEEDNFINIHGYSNSITITNVYNFLLQDLKNKEIHNYSKLYNFDIIITSSKENIEKLKNNYHNYEKENIEIQHENEINSLNEEIRQKENQLEELQNKYYELEEYNNNLKEEYEKRVEEYEDKINEYKNNLSILD